MQKPVQKRTLVTRARLLDEARAVVADNGYEALRVEEVVSRAGVAKGTFFAHFRDKNALMEILIGAELDRLLSYISGLDAPGTTGELIDRLGPVHTFMMSERYVFDLILHYSVAPSETEIGAITMAFDRYLRLVAGWLSGGNFRRDIAPDLLAEGVQAFAVQAMALRFCALHQSLHFADRLDTYLRAWLRPAG